MLAVKCPAPRFKDMFLSDRNSDWHHGNVYNCRPASF